MSQPIDEMKSINQKRGPEVGQKRAVKKSYVSPSLVEYGGIAKLTQTSAGTGTDFSQMMACL